MGNEWKKGGDTPDSEHPAPLNPSPSCCKVAPRGKLHCHNWLADVPGGMADDELVEVQFKNTRKGFFRNTTHLDLAIGDMVAVEAAPGHDIGQVTLTGKLVGLQMRRAGVKPDAELKRVFRKAKSGDLEKYEEAKARENDTKIRSRKIAADLKLNMKIGDVEYQGDGNKAIFYYIADERVDFRQLIKVLAETFHIRVEMRQIGARQEAGRIGGIGPCGRPLCCASWMTNFVSVGTAAARFQDISLNPQKLAGQCAKLKCCLNFEVDSYVESIKKMPSKEIRLETADATYYHFKYDVFKREITYSTDKNIAANLVTIDAKRAFEVIQLNKNGEKPLNLKREEEIKEADKKQYNDILGQDITRFDKKKKRRKNRSDKGQQPSKDASSSPKQRDPKDHKEPATQKTREPREQKAKEQKSSGQQQKGQKPQNQNGQRQKRRLRPGDTPDNTNLEAGRNAKQALPPAMSPSKRMMGEADQ